MSAIEFVIEECGRIADNAELSKWQLAMHIHAAYLEFPSYERGLTSGLMERLQKSSDSIYNLRDAEALRDRLQVEAVLSVSHFASLHRLQIRYALSDEAIRGWIDWCIETGAHVRGMREEIALSHEEDAKAAWARKAKRISDTFRTLYQESASLGMPEKLYQETKTASVVIEDWAASVGEWINSSS